MIIYTISDFDSYICGCPSDEDIFTVYSIQQSEEVFRGNWDELLESDYAKIELASFDIHPEPGVLICFNLDDEEYDYGD